MKITVLTSSRADYGIYLPLLKKLKADSVFQLEILAFGTHLSPKFGSTVDQIISDGFEVTYRIETLPGGDRPEDIASAMGATIEKFAHHWAKHQTDLILCLGDRYEMFSAVSASVPFGIKIAHLHGGETTAGAIDEAFRHSITAMASLHFVSTEKHALRVAQIKGSNNDVYNVGALSLDNLSEVSLYNVKEFKEKFGITLNNPILVTFHPETVNYNKNEDYIGQLLNALDKVKDQLLITMPNADTMGGLIRQKLTKFAEGKPNVNLVESLGTKGYFSALANCSMVVGNSSSGIIEAASFGKYVLNLGKRQEGRDTGKNVFHCDIEEEVILKAIDTTKTLPFPGKKNIYGDGGAAKQIVEILKQRKNEH
jgi:GDP/UDP-N,N'-diacetylbacillosamine 2-epimerase (hydrolysing)